LLYNIFVISVLGLGLSMDAFSVAVGYGVCFKKSNFYSALRLSLTTGIFQALMPLAGWLGGITLGRFIGAWTPLIASVMLFIVSLKMFYEAYGRKDDCEIYDISKGKHLFMMGLATSIDALAAGVTIGLFNIPVLISVVIIGVITFSMTLIGVWLGKIVGAVLEKYAEYIGAFIILALSIKYLVQFFIK